jgi:hypothetical protein
MHPHLGNKYSETYACPFLNFANWEEILLYRKRLFRTVLRSHWILNYVFINIFDTSDHMFYVPKITRILTYIFPLALQKRNFLMTDNFHGLI